MFDLQLGGFVAGLTGKYHVVGTFGVVYSDPLGGPALSCGRHDGVGAVKPSKTRQHAMRDRHQRELFAPPFSDGFGGIDPAVLHDFFFVMPGGLIIGGIRNKEPGVESSGRPHRRYEASHLVYAAEVKAQAVRRQSPNKGARVGVNGVAGPADRICSRVSGTEQEAGFFERLSQTGDPPRAAVARHVEHLGRIGIGQAVHHMTEIGGIIGVHPPAREHPHAWTKDCPRCSLDHQHLEMWTVRHDHDGRGMANRHAFGIFDARLMLVSRHVRNVLPAIAIAAVLMRSRHRISWHQQMLAETVARHRLSGCLGRQEHGRCMVEHMWIRLRQIAVVATDLRKAALDIGAVLGAEACFTDPGVKQFGLKNSLWPIGTQMLEVGHSDRR